MLLCQWFSVRSNSLPPSPRGHLIRSVLRSDLCSLQFICWSPNPQSGDIWEVMRSWGWTYVGITALTGRDHLVLSPLGEYTVETTEQQEVELRGSTYTWHFSINTYYTTIWSLVSWLCRYRTMYSEADCEVTLGFSAGWRYQHPQPLCCSRVSCIVRRWQSTSQEVGPWS